jgi:hypothetical protein
MGGLFRIANYEDKYPWLSTINLYGDTIFNNSQIKFLIDELGKLKTNLIDSSLEKLPFQTNYPEHVSEDIILENIKQVISFAKLDSHEYLRFLGD